MCTNFLLQMLVVEMRVGKIPQLSYRGAAAAIIVISQIKPHFIVTRNGFKSFKHKLLD
ncbi:hypothetical protein CASFOL_021043 [Castilleja foliolosa]|uniref:Uncharacterized protein n=1 Tax=Castilleja foliolosa TaxID=1961234 RepID=A0ABD3CWM4_9LAMI